MIRTRSRGSVTGAALFGALWFGAVALTPGLLFFPASAPGLSAQGSEIELVFTYGSEKKEWLEEVNKKFNGDPSQTLNGKRIKILGISVGSGEMVEDVLQERSSNKKLTKSPAHLISPASSIFIKLGNAESQKRLNEDLVEAPTYLVYSPVVIAMWQPMAEALGWPKKQIGWSDILDLAQDSKGWAKRGHPEWDPFRFGHTHPELSNSGMASVIATVYGAPNVNKTFGLTMEEVLHPKTGKFLEAIEKSIVYYGSSTGFFGDKMFKSGPVYLSAAVMYENMVIESYDKKRYKPLFPVVAVYPKEGTFVTDHPAAVVNRKWVTAEHREAAKKYLDFLMAPAQQRAAMKKGFRPGKEGTTIPEPLLTRDFGVDADQPKDRLQVPTPEVMDGILKLWQKHRKQMSLILVFDTSGSMNANDRLTNAKLGAQELVQKMNPRDYFTFIPFSDDVAGPGGRIHKSKDRQKAHKLIHNQIARGETALFDAIQVAYDIAQADDHAQLMPVIIVLTDGINNRFKGGKVEYKSDNEKALEQLLKHIRHGPEKPRIAPMFTIGYALSEKDADERLAMEHLRRIAAVTDGQYFNANPDTIEAVLRLIRKHF